MTHILAVDQGTTSSRAIIFDKTMSIVAVEQEEFQQHFPQSGWVEHEPEDIWSTVSATARGALAKANLNATDIAAIGITNQRETTIVWEKDSGRPIHRAIVWQDRRTAAYCAEAKAAGHEAMVTEKTGLLLDPYFSGTKVKYILDTVDGAREAARRGELLFGTVDTYLIWRATGGARHVTDATNAARTLLFNIREGRWDEEICELFDIPTNMLPEVLDCAADFGTATADFLGVEVPILGVAGDQQAATVGQACFRPGMMKSTYGTGCFALLNTGDMPVASSNRMLTTIAYRLNGKTTYALEGSIFIAGAVVQWLRDGLEIIRDAAETQPLAEAADPGQDIVLVPAFTGLGAPYWEPESRGAIYGLTRNTGPAEISRAALESVGFQTRDLLEAMQADWSGEHDGGVLRVDGGMTASDWTMQFLSDIIGAPVDRPTIKETTAVGAAWLAGMRAGLYPDQQGFADAWALERRFDPQLATETSNARYARWKKAVAATISV